MTDLTTDVALPKGGAIRVRPIVPEDREPLRRAFSQFSEQSRRLRFFRVIDELTESQLDYLTVIDYHDHFAWVAFSLDEEEHPGVGVARYVRLAEDPSIAEPAVAVLDAYQGRGIGRVLFGLLAETAVEHGIERFRAYVLSGNQETLEALRRLGSIAGYEEGAATLDVPLPLDPALYADTAAYELFRRAARGTLELA